LNTQVQTVQVDQCRNIKIQFESAKDFHSLVWNNTKEIMLKLLEGGEEKHVLSTGDPYMSSDESTNIEEDKPLNPYQYIIRLINDQLTTEELIRAEKGFPTTKREWTDWKRKNNIS
ncbi:13258_t:CDS:2, partial [Acaulospora morrowiae]